MDWGKENKKTYRIVLLLLLFSIISCAKNYKNIYKGIEENNNLKQQIEIIEGIKNEIFLYNYIKGIIFFNHSIYDSSFNCFEIADKYRRERFNDKTIKNIKSIILNPTDNMYFGEDYEDLFINYYKALILSQKEDYIESGVEARIISQKLKLFNTIYGNINSKYNYETDYPFAEFISGIFYYIQKEYNDAYISFKKADSLYNIKSYEIEKPIYTDSLIKHLEGIISGNTDRKIKFIFFQTGRINHKKEKNIYHTIVINKQFYQIKISYPYMKFSKSKRINVNFNNNNNNNKYRCLPQENLSERAYIMLDKKKTLIKKMAILQANIKLMISLGVGELTYGMTKTILSEKEKKEKEKKRDKKENKKNKNKDIESLAKTIGCITGLITNQYLNSLTKADIRQIFLLPNSIYIIPIMHNEKSISINRKQYAVSNKRIQIINDFQ